MAEAVYALCGVTSVVCAFLLLRTYLSTRARLLFWSSLCFVGLALNNLLLFFDLVITPALDLSALRGFLALAAMMILLFGLVWEQR